MHGTHAHAPRKVRYSVSFHRPKTLRLPRDPKYPRKSIPHAPRMDQFRTIVSCVNLALFSCCGRVTDTVNQAAEHGVCNEAD